MFAAVAAVDIATPPEVNLSILYVFLVLLATWNAGFLAGLGLAIGSALVQLLAMTGHQQLYSMYWYLWLANRVAVVFLVVLLTHPLRLLFDRQQAAVRLDPLTGAANRKYFFEILNMEVLRSRRSGQPFVVVFMDCDDFKRINDDLGHLRGDQFLCAVARAARAATRRSDTVARMGGDEFAILLPATSGANGRRVVERLEAELAELRAAHAWHATLSIGVAAFEGTSLAADAVLDACDSLMYRAKRSGKSLVVFEEYRGEKAPLAVPTTTGSEAR